MGAASGFPLAVFRWIYGPAAGQYLAEVSKPVFNNSGASPN
jgi:hypothetical protein